MFVKGYKHSITSLSGFILLGVNLFIKGRCKPIFLNLAKINHDKQPLDYLYFTNRRTDLKYSILRT